MRLAYLSLLGLSTLAAAVLGVAACTDDGSIDEDYPVAPGIGASSSGATGAGEGQDNGGINGPDDTPDGGTVGPDGTGSLDGGGGLPFDGSPGTDGGSGPDGDFTPLEDAA
jgi:hypothetical protein